LLPEVQWELVNDELKNLIKDDLTPISGELFSGSLLNPFKTTAQLNSTSGSVSLPANYVRFMSFGQFGYNDPVNKVTVENKFREITPVTPQKFVEIQNNIYARPDIHPVLKILGTAIYLIPNDIPLVNLDYIRVPVTPFYDYCIDSYGNTVYMPVGSYINAVNNVNYLYDVNNYVLASNVTKDNMTALPWKSQTVELEWEQRANPEFVYRILSNMGLNLSAEQITNHSEAKLKETNA
jgi:hypothetical protein